MTRNLIGAARRSYMALPSWVRRPLKDLATSRSYAEKTRGLTPDRGMTTWVASHRRPVSIVIPSYNDYPFLVACLASIERTCAEFVYEVVIVDDYCQPENSALLRTLESSRVRVIFKAKRQGFAISVNVGMKEAVHDIVLLNSDIVAQAGWLDALQFSAYAIDPAIGIVNPKLVYPNGTIQYAGTYYARLLAPQWFGHLHVGSPATRPAANVAGYNRSISGACAYITRWAYAELGSLDESFWLGFEDVDYGLTAWKQGIRCYYQPASLLIHHESASRGYSQGKRELASMRYFWSKWHDRFLSRTIDGVPEVDYVVSDRASELWREYVENQAVRLRERGHAVRITTIAGPEPDEAVIAALAPRDSIKIAVDWGAAQTTWLSSLEIGKAAYLLPGVESADFPQDPMLQAWIVAGYRPEFEYIAPNRWNADQLRAEAAWEVNHRLIPILPPAELVGETDGSVVTFALSAASRAVVDSEAARSSAQVVHFAEAEPSMDLLLTLRRRPPRVIVSGAEYSNSLAPLALMSLGAAYIGTINDKTRYEVLDGFNALLVGARDDVRLAKALDDVLGDDEVFSELAASGRATAIRIDGLNADGMSRVLHSIARTAV